MTLAGYAMMLIIGWQTYNIARDGGMTIAEASGQLALIGLLQFLPLFVLTPFSGLAADRFDRRKLARLTVFLQLLCAGALAFATWSEQVDLPILYTIAVVLGVVRGFAGPALSALAPNLVPKATPRQKAHTPRRARRRRHMEGGGHEGWRAGKGGHGRTGQGPR